MHPSTGRRRFLQSAAALGGGLVASAYGPVARAAPNGRALIGFQFAAPVMTLVETVLFGLQGNYEPDLGAKPVVIPGASGTIAMEAVLKAPADGSSVTILPSGLLTLLALARPLPNDPTAHLHPVAGVGEVCHAFVVGPAVPTSVRTMADYADWVRQSPMSCSYGVPGIGTAPHFVGRDIARTMGLPLKAVAYRGSPVVAADVQSGTLPAGIFVTPDASFLAMFPGLRLLGVTGDRRLPGHPDVPTMVESKMMEAPAVESLGFFFASGTPQAKVDELATAIRKTAATPVMMALMARINMRPMPPTTSSYAAVIVEERSTWLQLARRVEGAGPG